MSIIIVIIIIIITIAREARGNNPGKCSWARASLLILYNLWLFKYDNNLQLIVMLTTTTNNNNTIQ